MIINDQRMVLEELGVGQDVLLDIHSELRLRCQIHLISLDLRIFIEGIFDIDNSWVLQPDLERHYDN